MLDSKISIGTDIVEVKRFRQKPLVKCSTFYNSIYTSSELLYCGKYADPYPHLAGIFAAKEAIIKCSKRGLRMKSIEIGQNLEGKPQAKIHWNMAYTDIQISVSHTRSLAVAVAILVVSPCDR
jgi:holo-[acyl-carrier protein] synthase